MCIHACECAIMSISCRQLSACAAPYSCRVVQSSGLLRICCAVVQDTARSFAGTHDGKQKFKLYMEATHFDETTANLNAAESHVGGMRDILHKQDKHVKVIHSLLCCCQALVISKHVSGDQHHWPNSQALSSHIGQQVQICWSAGFEYLPSPPLH